MAASACTTDDGREDSATGIASIGPLDTSDTAPTSGTAGTDADGTAGTVGGTEDDESADGNTGSNPFFDVGTPGGTGTEPCKVQQPTVTYVEPIMVFVLDKSGSMTINQFDAGMGSITRWNALHNTVTYLLNTYQSSIAFGSKLFPSANGCNVVAGLDVNPTLDNGAAILGSMPPPGADLNAGGTSYTPVQRGMEEASTAMQSYDPAIPKAVLLLLDGGVSAAECGGNSFAGTQAVISDLWNTHGVPTYVVGVDISAGLVADMNAYAVAGGVPTGNPAEQFYNATNTAQLDMFMDTIVSEVLSCDIALDSDPEFPELTEVSVNGVPYNEIDQAQCDAGVPGWYWSVQYNQITLCGPACDSFLDAQAADVLFFCPEG